jgi:hypothetical protein
MSLPATDAVRAWINARRDLTGEGNPLALGAYLTQQRSPAAGAYAVLARQETGTGGTLTAEPSPALAIARVHAMVYAGTETAAETAAAALRTAWEELTGCPEPCGDTGTFVLVTDNHTGPLYVPMPGEGGEQFCFQVGADFVLAAKEE